MGLANEYIRRLATEAVRLLALLAASTAWAAPAYLAFTLRHDPRVALEPAVLTVLASSDSILMLLAPSLAVAGAVVVSFLMFDDAKLDVTSAIATCAVIAALFALTLAARQTPDMLLLRVADRVQATFAIAGIVVTGFALWRRSAAASLLWMAAFAGAIIVLLIASHPIIGSDPDLVRGLRSMAAETFTELVVWASALMAFFIQGYRGSIAAAST